MSGLSPEARETVLSEAFRAALDALKPSKGADPAVLSRKAIISLLEVLADGLDPVLIEAREPSDGVQVLVEHHTVSLLLDLTDALKDLDWGVVSDALRPANAGGGNRREAKRRKADKVLLDATEIALETRGPEGVAAIEKALARTYAKYDGKPLTPKRIQSFRSREEQRLKKGSDQG